MTDGGPFAYLQTVAPEAVAVVLAREDPVVVGAVLAHAPPAAVAKIMAYMSGERQQQSVALMRQGRNLPAGMQEKLARAFRQKLQAPVQAHAAAPLKPAGGAFAARPRGEAGSGKSRAPEAWKPRRVEGAVNARPPAMPPSSPSARPQPSQASQAIRRAVDQVRRMVAPGEGGQVSARAAGGQWVDGPALAAAILRFAPTEVRNNISQNDPVLYRELRRRMFVFDDLERSSDDALAQVFTASELPDTALALRFASPKLIRRVFQAVSPRRKEALREEIASGEKARVRVADIETAQQRVLESALTLQSAGRLLIDPSDPEILTE